MIKCLLTSDTHYGHSGKTHRRHLNFLKEIKLKIEEENIDVVIHAGDWTSYRQDQLMRTLEMFRKELGDNIPIMAVKGNHDFWDGYKGRRRQGRALMYRELTDKHKQWFRDNDITYLGDGAINNVKDVAIVGFDGWYSSSDPGTNDSEYIPTYVEGCLTTIYLSNKAHKDLDNLLQLDLSNYRKSICVTHFPPFSDDWKGKRYSANYNFYNPMKEKFDAICLGHSHQYVNRNEDSTWIYNSGSDYDKPRYLIFEV